MERNLVLEELNRHRERLTLEIEQRQHAVAAIDNVLAVIGNKPVKWLGNMSLAALRKANDEARCD